MKSNHLSILAVALLLLGPTALAGEQPLTVAVFNFDSNDEAVRDWGSKIPMLLTATLSANPHLITVERAELDKALGEIEMGLSGTIAPDTAARVGHLTGAKVLVTGRVFTVERETVIVAKIISTETSRVFGETVKGRPTSSVTSLTNELAEKIAATIVKRAEHLVAKVVSSEERIKQLCASVKKTTLPMIEVKITERHFGGTTHDPAAATELEFLLEKCGFKVVDSQSTSKPDIEIEGEAITERGMSKGALVSCKGRVELKLREKANGKLLVVDRQTAVAVDLSEQMAAKGALQQATQQLAERMIPRLAK